jgi:predicted nucleotidyltransferase
MIVFVSYVSPPPSLSDGLSRLFRDKLLISCIRGEFGAIIEKEMKIACWKGGFMRINEVEKKAVTEAVQAADPSARIWLFGSRADDTKRGGDIDIAVLSGNIGIPERMRIRRSITDILGEQKIDIVVSEDGSDPFFRLAIETGTPLHG